MSGLLTLLRSDSAFVLDQASGAAAAYGLRKLRAAYTGSAIRVRRSSDNAEQDIGFSADGNLDIAALLAFVGSGNGFVVTWYDQTGNGRHATQSTTANQPQIVSSGTLIASSGKPSIQFDGANDELICGGTATAMANGVQGITAFTVFESSTTDAIRYAWIISINGSNSNARFGLARVVSGPMQSAARVLDADAGSFMTTSGAVNGPSIATSRLAAATPINELYINGTLSVSGGSGLTAQSTLAATDSNTVRIGSRSGSFWTGYISEWIVYTSLPSPTTRQRVERNQGTYFGIAVA